MPDRRTNALPAPAAIAPHRSQGSHHATPSRSAASSDRLARGALAIAVALSVARGGHRRHRADARRPSSRRRSMATTASTSPPTRCPRCRSTAWCGTRRSSATRSTSSASSPRPAPRARPPASTRRRAANVLAYNLTTGALIPGFVANTNGQAKTVTRSPDGSRIYIGGQFTTVNGTNRYRIAAAQPHHRRGRHRLQRHRRLARSTTSSPPAPPCTPAASSTAPARRRRAAVEAGRLHGRATARSPRGPRRPAPTCRRC